MFSWLNSGTSNWKLESDASGVGLRENLIVRAPADIGEWSGSFFLKSGIDRLEFNPSTHAGKVTFSGDLLIIDRDGQFAPGRDYELEIPEGAFKKDNGKVIKGTSGELTFETENVLYTLPVRNDDKSAVTGETGGGWHWSQSSDWSYNRVGDQHNGQFHAGQDVNKGGGSTDAGAFIYATASGTVLYADAS